MHQLETVMDLWSKQEADAYAEENCALQRENTELRRLLTRTSRMLHAQREITRDLRAGNERLGGILHDIFAHDPSLHNRYAPAVSFGDTEYVDDMTFLVADGEDMLGL